MYGIKSVTLNKKKDNDFYSYSWEQLLNPHPSDYIIFGYWSGQLDSNGYKHGRHCVYLRHAEQTTDKKGKKAIMLYGHNSWGSFQSVMPILLDDDNTNEVQMYMVAVQ